MNGTVFARIQGDAITKGPTMIDDRRQKGFTLTELLVAMTIFAIGILSVATMQVTALQGNASANTVSVAGSLGASVLEEIISWDISDPRLAADSANNVWDFAPATAATSINVPGAGIYNASYDIDVDFNGVPNVVRVEVRISGGSGKFGLSANRVARVVGFKRTI